MKTTLLAALALVGLSAVPAGADGGRYTLQKTEQGYVRMDTQTGAMSICEQRADQLVCRAAADERQAFQDEIDRLQDRLLRLEGRVATIENSPVMNPRTLLPTDEQFERSLGYMERFFRKFMDIVKDMNDQSDSATPRKT